MPRRRERGFFIIWGSRNRITSHGGSIDAVCPSCRQQAKIEGKQLRNWFTLYFIPIFPTGESRKFSQCSNCKAQFSGAPEQLRAFPSGQPEINFQAAIKLFNELRETPADSGKLLRLLRMYMEMEEPREAISAARTYGQALEHSTDCMAVISTACWATGDRAEALKWATASLALDPSNTAAQAIQSRALAATLPAAPEATPALGA